MRRRWILPRVGGGNRCAQETTRRQPREMRARMRRAQNENIQDLAQARDVWPRSGMFQVLLRQKQKFLPSDQYCPVLSKGIRKPKALVKRRSPGETAHFFTSYKPRDSAGSCTSSLRCPQKNGLPLGSLVQKPC